MGRYSAERETHGENPHNNLPHCFALSGRLPPGNSIDDRQMSGNFLVGCDNRGWSE
jgi:hypothetical protein